MRREGSGSGSGFLASISGSGFLGRMKKTPSLNNWLPTGEALQPGAAADGPGGASSPVPSLELTGIDRTSSGPLSPRAPFAGPATPPKDKATVVFERSDKMTGPSPVQKGCAALLLTLVTSAGGILMQLSKVNGEYQYNTATVPFLAELLKLCISGIALCTHRYWGREPLKMTKKFSTMIKYTVPSILYMFCNNLSLEALRYLKPSTYQILGNLRIVTTGLLTVVLLRRPLSRIQWIALVLMTIGATTSQLGEASSNGPDAEFPVVGYALCLVLCCTASLAGVYTERVMKEIDDTIHWQNAQLYFCGVFFNAVRLTVDDSSVGFHNGFWMLTLLEGYSLATWLVVANLAFSGLLVSFIMKYVDVIAKNFATASAMFLTPFASLLLFGHQPTFALLVGATVATISLSLYYSKKEDMFNIPEAGAGGAKRAGPLFPPNATAAATAAAASTSSPAQQP